MNEDFAGPVPAEEIQIGRTLRRWRLSQGGRLSVAKMSKAIGETRARLVNYEHGRSPIAWGVARKLWEVFGLSPRFLATGTGPMVHPFPALRSLVPQAADTVRFSEVYAAQIAAEIERQDRRNLETAITSLETFAKLARKGTIPAATTLALAEVAHSLHAFPPTVKIGGGERKPAPLKS